MGQIFISPIPVPQNLGQGVPRPVSSRPPSSRPPAPVLVPLPALEETEIVSPMDVRGSSVDNNANHQSNAYMLKKYHGDGDYIMK
ncbi:hypothetical protein KY284_019951 [Solanum tuberosum]|nr:hypothetical protein KY284_019951 [Solanum tuberosum]